MSRKDNREARKAKKIEQGLVGCRRKRRCVLCSNCTHSGRCHLLTLSCCSHSAFIRLAKTSLTSCTAVARFGNVQASTLRAGRSGDRMPVGARFFSPVQTGPGVQPASCTMGTASFPGVKRPRRGVDHPPHLALKLKKE